MVSFLSYFIFSLAGMVVASVGSDVGRRRELKMQKRVADIVDCPVLSQWWWLYYS